MKPLIPRAGWSELDKAEATARQQRKSHEAFQKEVMGRSPGHRTSIAKRLSKTILVPLSRPRLANEFFRLIGVLGNVQKARIKLLDDDEAIVKRFDQDLREYILRAELQRLTEGGVSEFFVEFEVLFPEPLLRWGVWSAVVLCADSTPAENGGVVVDAASTSHPGIELH